MPFCIHCGKEVSEDALVCPHCGKTLAIAPRGAGKPTPKEPSGLEVAGLAVGVTGFAVVIMAGAGMATNLDLGFGLIGLGMLLLGILFLVFARRSKS
jgi:DNA-directed RNA polymerase subunit RPC12/RpoP